MNRFELGADEILAMAEEVERNGRDFYLAAADCAPEEEARQLFSQLAEWEEKHESMFISMRAGLKSEEKTLELFEAGSEQELFLRAVASANIFKADTDAADTVRQLDSVNAVLDHAMAMEREAILFFAGLRAVVPENKGKAKIDELLKEEISHVAILKKQISRLSDMQSAQIDLKGS
mgnify:CR=1 FL=1